ncbi:hypothetical protein [Amphritea japonica]|uniref:Uncharacterized protein n=1 Tax=Amphritea japonica ATCC BAA-1530 TaxID=1278309 RepID=A0A7R6SSH0_9GAMM|nr:hypothetical protein [Amphritea japonica]BBB26245.1 hypothetical protein AMJAP_1650 [Amphritea japonica ATCC BAA-1530]
MRNLAFFLGGFLFITLVALAPEAFAVTSAQNQVIADKQTADISAVLWDIYLLMVAGVCILAFGLGFIGGQQR